MIIDTHCHYNLSPLDGPENSWQGHWQEAQHKGVVKSVVVGTSLETSQRAVDIAKKDSNLFAAVGIHPSEYQEDLDLNIPAQMSDLLKLCSQEKTVAIGETGLDYFRLPDDLELATKIKEKQQQALAAHLELAAAHQLPVIIHVRDRDVLSEPTAGNAYWDVINILEAQPHLPQFVLHCISGPISYLERALDLGGYVGVAANVTYKNADHIRSLVKLTPPNKLVLETDAPYLPPQAYRGKPCEPWMISLTAEFLEEELGIDRKSLSKNAQQLFPQLLT